MRKRTTLSDLLPGGIRAGLFVFALLLVLLLASPNSSVAAIGTQGFSVATAMESETSVAVDGNTAVWTVSRTGGTDIQGKNLATGQNLNLAPEPGVQGNPAVGGRYLVWEDTTSGSPDIYGYDLSTNQKFPVVARAGSQTKPAVAGNLVVWQDNRNGNSDVYAFDLDTRQEKVVTTAPGGQYAPDVEGGTVVWEDRDALDSDVVAKDLSTGAERTLASGPGWQDAPVIGGETIVWQEEGVLGNVDINGYDLKTDDEIPVAAGPGDQLSPTVDGRLVAWVEGSGNADVRAKDLSTGETFLAAGGSADQQSPDVSGERVIWEVQRTGDEGFGTYDLQGTRADLAPLAPSGLTAHGSATGIGLDWATSPEDDLAGYNVYRAASADGSYAKLNTRGPLSSSSFSDPDAPKGVRSFYKVTAVDVRGSESAAARAAAVAPRETGISLSASPSQLDLRGGTATLSGRLDAGDQGLAGKTVALERRPEGETAWSPVTGGNVPTGPDGGFSLAVPDVDRDTDYRAVFAGTEDALSSTSPLAHVDVQTVISVRTSVNALVLGRSLTISGLVLPNKTGDVNLTIKRAGATVGQQTAALSNGTFKTTYKPTAVGSYEVTAAFGSGPDDAATVAKKTFLVKRPIRR